MNSLVTGLLPNHQILCLLFGHGWRSWLQSQRGASRCGRSCCRCRCRHKVSSVQLIVLGHHARLYRAIMMRRHTHIQIIIIGLLLFWFIERLYFLKLFIMLSFLLHDFLLKLQEITILIRFLLLFKFFEPFINLLKQHLLTSFTWTFFSHLTRVVHS